MPKGTQRKLPREKAKEILGEVDSTLSSLSQQRARQSVVKLLNRVPTYSWVGIYLMKGSELVLDAWSGPQATEHVKIPLGKGVCGFAAKSGKTEIVADVTKDSRYLQCFANTKSEIVVPILETGKVLGEIDVDSDVPDAFSSVDKEFLEAVAVKLSPHCPSAQSRPDS